MDYNGALAAPGQPWRSAAYSTVRRMQGVHSLLRAPHVLPFALLWIDPCHSSLSRPRHTAEAYRDMPHLCVINSKGIEEFRSHAVLKSLL